MGCANLREASKGLVRYFQRGERGGQSLRHGGAVVPRPRRRDELQAIDLGVRFCPKSNALGREGSGGVDGCDGGGSEKMMKVGWRR
ncbi:hypothetical protein ACS0TY_013797 [Phlomoides rotata]